MLEVSETNLLLALVKSLAVAKFDGDPETFLESAGSPFVAEVFDRAYDALIEAYRREGNELGARELESQRDASGRVLEQKAVMTYVRMSMDSWLSWDDAGRRDYLRLLFRPYVASDSFLTNFIRKVRNQ